MIEHLHKSSDIDGVKVPCQCCTSCCFELQSRVVAEKEHVQGEVSWCLYVPPRLLGHLSASQHRTFRSTSTARRTSGMSKIFRENTSFHTSHTFYSVCPPLKKDACTFYMSDACGCTTLTATCQTGSVDTSRIQSSNQQTPKFKLFKLHQIAKNAKGNENPTFVIGSKP